MQNRFNLIYFYYRREFSRDSTSAVSLGGQHEGTHYRYILRQNYRRVSRVSRERPHLVWHYIVIPVTCVEFPRGSHFRFYRAIFSTVSLSHGNYRQWRKYRYFAISGGESDYRLDLRLDFSSCRRRCNAHAAGLLPQRQRVETFGSKMSQRHSDNYDRNLLNVARGAGKTGRFSFLYPRLIRDVSFSFRETIFNLFRTIVQLFARFRVFSPADACSFSLSFFIIKKA